MRAVPIILILGFCLLLILSNRNEVRTFFSVKVATEWEVRATEWPLGEARFCYFFPMTDKPFAGCWEQFDDVKQEHYNRDDHPNDHEYLMKASLPENVKQALAQHHNQKAFCARDEAMHLSCSWGGNI